MIDFDDYKLIGTHWIGLYVNGNNGSASYDAVCFDSFGGEHIPKETNKFIGNGNITTNIYRIQVNNSIISGYFCTGFINVMLKGKSLLD